MRVFPDFFEGQKFNVTAMIADGDSSSRAGDAVCVLRPFQRFGSHDRARTKAVHRAILKTTLIDPLSLVVTQAHRGRWRLHLAGRWSAGG
jgi:hypothetical protein